MKRFLMAVIAGVMAAALCVGVSACGGGSSSSSGTTASSESGSGESAGGESGGSVSTEGIGVAYASALDPNDVADQFGLKEAGADVETLNEDSAVIAGLQRGSIEVGNVDYDAAVEAVVEGLPIKIIYISRRPRSISSSPTRASNRWPIWRGRRSATRSLARRPNSSPEPGQRGGAGNLRRSGIHRPRRILAAGPGDGRRPARREPAGDDQPRPARRTGRIPLDRQMVGPFGLRQRGARHRLDHHRRELRKEKAKLQAFVEDLQKGYNTAYADEKAWLSLAEETLSEVETKLLPRSTKCTSGRTCIRSPGNRRSPPRSTRRTTNSGAALASGKNR